MNQQRIREGVSSAERTACQALQFLDDLKGKGGQSRMSHHGFQVLLGEAVFSLQELRSEITREERELVLRKPRLSRDWFRKRMRSLGEYRSILDSAAQIVTSIGDAYAWLFYRKKSELLWEHLRKPKQVVSSGVGGLGELAFVSGVPRVHGMPVLSHMTTSILRVGDVTLIDPATAEATALGELKTKETGDGEFRIRLEVVGKGKDFGEHFSVDRAALATQDDPIWPPLKRRLIRQVHEMVDAVSFDNASTQRHDMRASYYTEELQELGQGLGKRSLTYVQAGPNLLLVGIRNRARRSLWARLQAGSPAGFQQRLRDLPHETLKILNQESSLNSLHSGILDGAYFPGGTPLWWWPVDQELLRQIYLRVAIVVVLYNPAGLVAQLLADGFVSDDPTARNPSFHLPVGEDREIALGNFSFWISTIVNHLTSEDAVLTAIKKVTQALLDSKPSTTTRMDVAFNQHLFY